MSGAASGDGACQPTVTCVTQAPNRAARGEKPGRCLNQSRPSNLADRQIDASVVRILDHDIDERQGRPVHGRERLNRGRWQTELDDDLRAVADATEEGAGWRAPAPRVSDDARLDLLVPK